MACLDDQQLAQLASGEGGGSSEHLNTCASCTSRLDALRLAETLANPRNQLESAIGSSARFGRYLVIERIGAGGMGEVFAAFDPTLDRKIALKLLRVDRDDVGSNGRERLQREAQAMAQIAHPNVAAVHDVGVHDGQVFVAMEFIDGETLRDWCLEPGRTTQQVLDVYQQAGRGLAAAHRAGLIHRDFKPANVLVGTDGRPRVLDFGLARVSNVTPVSDAAERSIGSVDLTAAGSVMGTPASFCVSLYEGLVGVLPFQGDSLKSIRAAIVGGLPAQAPRQIPARVFSALRRGLSVSPADRFPSMEALLEALSNDAQLRRRRWLLMGGLGVSTLLAVAGLVSREVASRHCASAAPRLAGAWDSSRREALTKSLSSTTQGAAVVSRLEAYAQQWVGVSQRVCEAHRTRQQTPTAKHVLQTACLDRRLSDLRALTSVLATADASILKGATVAVSGLRPLATCFDASAEYAEAEQERTDVEAKLSEARALARLGLAARAQTLATDVTADPFASRRAQAEAWLVLGTVAHANTRFDEAERALNAAAAKGIAAGSFEVAAKAWSLMVDLYGRRLDKPKLAQEKADLAEGALTRLGDDPEIAAYALHAVGRFRLGESNYTAASQVFERALAQAERAWGPDHPEVANVLDDLAWSYSWLGKTALSQATFERSLRIKAAVYAPDSVENAETLGRLAMVVAEAGDLPRAIELQERALSIRRGAATKPDFAVTTSLTNLTELYKDAGRLDDALATIDESLRILGRILEGDHLRVVGNLHTRGEVLLSLGRLDDARHALSDSLAMSERVKGPQHVLSADPLEGLAEVALKEHKPADAVPLLERALTLRERTPAHPLSHARTRFLLARALWESDADVARAKTLLVSARADFEAAGPQGHSRLRELDQWPRPSSSIERVRAALTSLQARHVASTPRSLSLGAARSVPDGPPAPRRRRGD